MAEPGAVPYRCLQPAERSAHAAHQAADRCIRRSRLLHGGLTPQHCPPSPLRRAPSAHPCPPSAHPCPPSAHPAPPCSPLRASVLALRASLLACVQLRGILTESG